MSVHAFVAFMLWSILAIVIGVHASKRGRSGILWGILTFFTGLIGAIIYLLVLVNDLDNPDREEEEDVRVCPSCSARHTGSPDYCSDCGEPLEAEDEASTAEIIRSGANGYCSNCNSRVDFDAESCSSCGSVF